MSKDFSGVKRDGEWLQLVPKNVLKILLEQAGQTEDLGVAYDNAVKEVSILKNRVKELEELQLELVAEINETKSEKASLNIENRSYREAIKKAIHEVHEGYYPEWIIKNLDKALEESE